MSEMEYKMVCPVCRRYTIVMFSGSGTKGKCTACGYDLPPTKCYTDYDGYVIGYSG